jgi:ribonuclease VapC
MILDTSSVLAILRDEEDGPSFAEKIREADICRISAASFVELSMVLEATAGDTGILACDTFFRENEILVEPFTEEHALAARHGFSRYGKGRHPAGLNLGDCFSYGLAKVTGEPLLFKGNDFRKTDVKPAA